VSFTDAPATNRCFGDSHRLKKAFRRFYRKAAICGRGHEPVYFQARTRWASRPRSRAHRRRQSNVLAKVATLNDDKEPGVNQGMGSCRACGPGGRAAYELKIDSPAGIESRFVLPEVKADGVVMNVAGRAITTTFP